jgi:hypothetical protein
MKQVNSSRLSLVIVALVALSALSFIGCSHSPLSPTTNTTEPHLLSRVPSKAAAAAAASDGYAEAVIPAATGGQLSLLDVTLDIPAGALDNDTLFSITIPDVNVFYNEFGTNGLVFKKPVKVTMSYRDADLSGVNESSIRIAWFNERTGAYDDVVCSVDFANKEVTGYLNHFSAYALISD